MLDYYDCNAFCAPCPDLCATRRLNEERYTFCLTHSLLGEQGVMSGCEYDIPATLSMTILSNFAHAPAYMGNTTHQGAFWATGTAADTRKAVNVNLDESIYRPIVMEDPFNTILIWHSVPKRNMRGFGQPNGKFAIRPFASSGFGATLRYDFAEDSGTAVTMARIDPACNKLFVARGSVVACKGYNNISCTLGVFIRVADGDDFYQKQLFFGNHVSVVYGDVFDKVCKLGKLLNLEVVTA